MGKVVLLCWFPIMWTCLINIFISMPFVTCVMIRNSPTNVTVLQGRDTTFICNVREQRPTDYVFWKKVTKAGFLDILSYNSNIMNGSKYSIQGSYSLTVKDVRLEDEAWYECQAGVDRARAMLNVNVMMDNMTLTWGTDPPFTGEELVNLTCHVTHSRPPADITWFHGQTELTGLASTCQKSNDVDGFGDSTSILTVVIGQDAEKGSYRCVASLPHSDSSRTEVAFATKAAGYTSGSEISLSADKYLMFVLTTVTFMTLLFIQHSLFI